MLGNGSVKFDSRIAEGRVNVFVDEQYDPTAYQGLEAAIREIDCAVLGAMYAAVFPKPDIRGFVSMRANEVRQHLLKQYGELKGPPPVMPVFSTPQYATLANIAALIIAYGREHGWNDYLEGVWKQEFADRAWEINTSTMPPDHSPERIAFAALTKELWDESRKLKETSKQPDLYKPKQ